MGHGRRTVRPSAGRRSINPRRATGGVAVALAALGIAPAAHAAVKSPRSIEVAHGRDLVILTGYPKRASVTVDVLRAGVVIATSTQYETDASGTLELNHLGAGDCFDGGTAPDVRPGDTVRTTLDGEDVDAMVVQDVTYDGAPVERTVTTTTTVPNPDPALPDIVTTETRGTGVYEVTGLARTDDGRPLPGDVEVRLNHPLRSDWDATGRRDWRVTAQADADGRYVAAFDTGGSADDAAAVADADLSVLWLGSTTELSGYDGTGSPCPPAPTSAITTLSHAVVNADVPSIRLAGPLQDGVSASVDLPNAVVTQSPGGWSATIPASDLAEGDNLVTVAFTGPGAPSPDSRLVKKDTTAPALPTSDLPSGEYDLPQTVHLYGENEVRYTTDGSTPTRSSTRSAGAIGVTAPRTIKAVAVDAAGNVSPVATFAYARRPPAATSAIARVSHAIVNAAVPAVTLGGPLQDGAHAFVDIAGAIVAESAGTWSATVPVDALREGDNVIAVRFEGLVQPSVATHRVTKDTVAPAAPTADLASGAYDLPQAVTLTGEHEIRYTTDGSTPTAASARLSGAISVTTARTIKAVAVDAAGNLSAVATFAYGERPKPEPITQTIVVERPVEVVRPGPAPAIVVRAPRIDAVVGPRRVTLAMARRGVRLVVVTRAAAITVRAGKGARVTRSARLGTGHRLVVTARRRGTYRVAIGVTGGATRVVSLEVR